VTDPSSVVAVVPTFRPPEPVEHLIHTISQACGTTIVSDDASPCTSDRVLRKLEREPSVKVLRHRSNRGIARGLNNGLNRALETSTPWLLTVDQDSTISPDYVTRLLTQAHIRLKSGERLGALGAETIHDASGSLRYPVSGNPESLVTEEVIQTGTLWSVDALASLGGFNEDFGIDAVDAAACLGLRENGFTIGVAAGLSLEHRIGSSRSISVGSRTIMITGHSPERRASMIRNRLRLFPGEFAQSPRHAFRTLRRVGVNQGIGLMTESNKSAKLKGTIQGIRGKSSR
jgi:rhamnosyltransferase